MEGLGRVFDVIHQASGVHIPLTRADAVTFISFLDAGTQTATIKESIQGASEQNLACITKIYKAPGVGGTWTKTTQAAAATYNHATDATNDMIAICVRADQLSDGFDCVEYTAGSGTCIAIIHDLLDQAAPERRPSNIP